MGSLWFLKAIISKIWIHVEDGLPLAARAIGVVRELYDN